MSYFLKNTKILIISFSSPSSLSSPSLNFVQFLLCSNTSLSFSNLTGEIPATSVFLNHKPNAFAENPNLCEKPVKNPSSIPSTLSTQPNISTSTSSLMISAILKTLSNLGNGGAAAVGNGTVAPQKEGGLRLGMIVGIVVEDLARIEIVSMVFLYMYQARKK